jgi:nickel-dependent lactate racemase
VDGETITEMAKRKNAKSACVLVSDATRNVPNSLVAGLVVKALTDGGVPLSGIRFFVALGVHRDATEAEMRGMLGESLWGKVSIENHTPYDKSNLIYLGTTACGTPVEVNKRAWECDLHLSIGKVEPHEFAGFSGGRKSVLPGISSERTILSNHSPRMLYCEGSIPGALEGNPIHQDMVETANLFRLDYTISFVLNCEGEPAAVFGGSMLQSHAAAVKFSREYIDVLVGHPDIIVTTPGSPLNIDFYQSLKPLIALTGAVDEHTTIALYCACPEGINSEDMMVPFRATDSLEEMVHFVVNHYRIQMDHALLLSKILKKRVKLLAWSPNVAEQDLKRMYFIPCTGASDLMKKAYEACGKEHPRVLFFPQAQKSLPSF